MWQAFRKYLLTKHQAKDHEGYSFKSELSVEKPQKGSIRIFKNLKKEEHSCCKTTWLQKDEDSCFKTTWLDSALDKLNDIKALEEIEIDVSKILCLELPIAAEI